MSMHNKSTAPVPTHFTRMLKRCVAAGLIKRIGDHYEITPAGHKYAAETLAELQAATLEGNSE